jgi:hypothetical protein
VLAAAVSFPQSAAGANEEATHFSTGVASSGATAIIHKGVLGGTQKPFTATTADVITCPAHGLVAGDRVVFEAMEGFSLPTGLTEGTSYFVIATGLTTDAFEVSTLRSAVRPSISRHPASASRRSVRASSSSAPASPRSSAPVRPSRRATSTGGVWSGRWAPGAYGGGVIGQGGGHGIGNVFTYGPNAAWINVAGITRLYASLRVYFDFDSTQWHPISNKFVNIEGDHSLFLVQLNEGGNWRHAEELGSTGYPSFGVDFNRSAGDVHLAGQIDNRPVPTRQWVQLEILIDLPNHVFKVWQDGVLTTNAAPTFASTKIRTFGINAFRGGGGETLTTDLSYKYDHFFLAW